MKTLILLALISLSFTYDRNRAVSYADAHVHKINHSCGKYSSCTPYSYWGNEHCGYPGQGGDCANFVSQCLIEAGHPYLKGSENCRGYPCGKEEPGAMRLALCLKSKGWQRTCGYLAKPPSNIKKGDVIVYHKGSCDNWSAHAAIVVEGGASAKISCHSNEKSHVAYTYMGTSMPYYEWLHYPD